MSELDGERAFDMIMDRLIDANRQLDHVCRERDEARAVKLELERQVRNLEGRMLSAVADATRYKAMIPEHVFTLAPTNGLGEVGRPGLVRAEDEVPF